MSQLFVTVRDGVGRVLVGVAAFIVRGSSKGLACLVITFVVFRYCLHMVVGRGDMAGCGKVMVLAGWVAGGIGHDVFLPIGENSKMGLLAK